jgi:hypothetical protein
MHISSPYLSSSCPYADVTVISVAALASQRREDKRKRETTMIERNKDP